MAKKKSSFHMGDEFNGNGKKTYLRATQHNTYAPLPQNNVRLTPDFSKFVPVATGAIPVGLGGVKEVANIAINRAIGSVASVSQVELEKEEETGKYRTRFFLHKIAMTTGSHLYSSFAKLKKDILEEILPQNEPIILDGWLTLYSESTVSADGREVLRHPDAAKRDWAMKEDLRGKAEDWFETESPASKEISSKGDFEVQLTTNNLYTDYEGRYWVAVGPCVMDPEYPKERVNHPIPASKMCYGTKIDIVVMDKEENTYYIPAVVGDAKEHSYPDGLYQTGIPFDTGRPTATKSDHNTVEFIGREITTKIYDDGNEKSSINITNRYQLIKIIVYDGVFNYE